MIAMDGHMVAEKSIRDAHGSVEFTFGKEVPDGIYLLRFQADEGMGSVRVLLQR
jgi:hypothetical protein